MIAKLREVVLGKPPADAVEVSLTRAVRVRLASGKIVDGKAGESFAVTKGDAEGLVSANAAEVIPSDEEAAARAKREAEAAALIPAAIEPEPLPKSMGDLPKPFADWWRLRERRRCLAERSELIAERFRLEWLQLGEADGKIENAIKIPDPGQRREVMDKLLAGRVRIITADPGRWKRIETLKAALYESWQALASFTEESRDALWRAKILSGDATVHEHGCLTKAIRELAGTGLDLFRTRIAALGLGEADVQRLFRGSADAEAYLFDEPSLHNFRLAWVDEQGPRHFLDLTLDGMATHFRRFKLERERMEGLLPEARKQLKRAQAVESAS